ncbi:MAG TPA: cysteine desulfurase family protein [Candidatus Saccharimonadales bacterium]|nr:cysteine desulfurase family protein [Candidatus Saccharimonadales bacterium]
MNTDLNLYFDYAAATPMDAAVLAAMQPYFFDSFYNPSATYLPAQAVRNDLETARSGIAAIIGAKRSEIIFTAGATEANNLAIRGVMEQFSASNVVVSAIEHESVLRPAEVSEHRVAPVDAAGIIDIARLADCIDEQTVLVSVMYANNEVGTVQPIRAIARLIEKIRRQRQANGNSLPLYLHSDAAQAATYLDLHASRLGVDMMSLNGGKIYGSKQSGILFVGSHVNVLPLISGGGQERGLRSGTENVAGAIGLAKALELVQAHRHEESQRLRMLQKLFVEQLKTRLPQAVINGSIKERLPNNVHITIPGTDNERLILELEQQGILCAAGSACSASNEEPSHVLRAMGLSDDQARSSLRFSMGKYTDESAIRLVVTALAEVIKNINPLKQ